ncbi:MAG: hypothetical protein IPH93_09950 [Saprospiraceae bacterium]|nr:hypothetical protein [Saprospiraceae bacterium]
MYSTVLWALLFLYFSNHQKITSIVMVEICDNALDDDGDGLIDLNDIDYMQWYSRYFFLYLLA